MPENAIISEIHQHREEVARLCDFDPAKLIAYYRRRERQRQRDGHPLVTLSLLGSDPCVVREEPTAT